jgi:hypothetical protein
MTSLYDPVVVCPADSTVRTERCQRASSMYIVVSTKVTAKEDPNSARLRVDYLQGLT